MARLISTMCRRAGGVSCKAGKSTRCSSWRQKWCGPSGGSDRPGRLESAGAVATAHRARGDERHPEQDAPDRGRLRPDVLGVRLNYIVWCEPGGTPEVEGFRAVFQDVGVDAFCSSTGKQFFGALDQLTGDTLATVLRLDRETCKVGAPAVPCRYDSADEYIAVPDGEEQFGVICRAAEGRDAPRTPGRRRCRRLCRPGTGCCSR